MGWKINVVDDFNKRYLITSGNGSAGFEPSAIFCLTILVPRP
jgi:hypothetical protein